jgi:hypothetical protein
MRAALRIGSVCALIAVSAGVAWLWECQAQLELRTRRDVLERQAGRLSLLVEENARLSNQVARASASPPLTKEQLLELLRLRNEKHWLAEQTNLSARLATGTWDPSQLSPAELETVLCAEMLAAMQQILPVLQPALQRYALVHSNQPPDSFSKLRDYFPLAEGRKMVGLETFEFVRGKGPRPGDALVLRGNTERQQGNANEVRVYGFSDGRVVEVSSADGLLDAWEAQHLTSALAGTEEQVYLQADPALRERARLVEMGAGLGVSAEDASRLFDRVSQQHEVLGPSAVEEAMRKLAIETPGDKGPAMEQKQGEHK